ncbi:MAG: amidohydrolase family protein [Alphaproteobacteria bacterium]|nr:amidohydrolase family protein [Alphaproteobacteria bacterium]
MSAYDLIIRNGTIVDGTGAKPFEGDVAVSKGRIAEVGGRISARGVEEIDARGLIVTPGFVDIHTHYDGQATWDNRLSPSSIHGVTTAVFGNCGIGFAPCRPDDHDRLISLMEGVEDIPHPVLQEGLKWNWESFGDFLNALEEIPHDIDFGAQLPHGALRVYVMGDRGAKQEPATDQDIFKMAALAREAMRDGALGFSTSRTLNHKTADGNNTPSYGAAEKELVGIAMGLKQAGLGVLQVVSDFPGGEREFGVLRRMVEASGRPLSVSVGQAHVAPESYKNILGWLKRANEDGLTMRAQVCGRPVGILLGLELTLNPFSGHPVYKEIADRPFTERLNALRDPAFQTRLLASEPNADHPFVKSVLRGFDYMYILTDPPNYEPDPSTSIGAQARAKGIAPERILLDIITGGDGKAQIYFCFVNYANGSLDPSYIMINDPNCVMGLSDGGAHVGTICDGSFPTSNLTHWTRDRTRGPKVPLEKMIAKQTRETALTVGLGDRGLLKRGYKADINVIDYDRLTLHLPKVQYDLPSGGRRLMQYADGYVATIVNGQPVYRGGQATGALPGRLVRGARDVEA